MRGIHSVEIETVPALKQLPPDALDLLDQAPGIFMSRAWWDVVIAHAVPAGAMPSFVVMRSSGRIAALLPILRAGGKLTSLTTLYTCAYTPLFAVGLSRAEKVAAMAAFGRLCRSSGTVRLDALPVEWEGLADFEAGAQEAGLRVARFDHFGNWYDDAGGASWSDYLRRRPGAMRETIRRRLHRTEKLADARFELLTGPEQMDAATAAFETVYRRSWKDVEPYPAFNTALMRALAPLGLLRAGIWSIGSTPVAAQIWVLKDGHATVLKLAHDEAYSAHSPGTVLTALMLRHLLDHDAVTQIDFGRGDDAYKQGWAGKRRQRVGLLLVNPWHAAGATALLRHGAGRVRAALWRSIPALQPAV